MGRITDYIGGFFGGKEESTSLSAWEFLLGPQHQGVENPFDDLGSRDLAEMYAKNALIHRCVREIATSAGEPPAAVVRLTDGPRGPTEPAPDHWANRLLVHPNRDQDWPTLIYRHVLHKVTTGASGIWKWPVKESVQTDDTGPVGELWPIPTHRMKVRATDGLGPVIRGYSVQQSTSTSRDQWRPVDPEWMIYNYFPSPTSPWKAAGPLQAASNDAQLDNERQQYFGEMMQNIVLPGLAITGESMTPSEREDARQDIEAKAGRGKRGSTLFMTGSDIDAKMYQPMADLDLPGLISMSESRLCTALGVPAELVGARVGLEHSTYSNKAEARIGFYVDTLRPLWRNMEAMLTKGLLHDHGDDEHVVRFDLSAIEPLQAAMSDKRKRIREDYEAGIISREEARAEGGRPEEWDEDDTFHVERREG